MKFILTIIGVLVMISHSYAQSKHQFEYANPEAKGYSSEKLEVLKKHLQESGSSSMIILVDGSVIFEWGEVNKKHLIHSMRKAVLNSLYGIAISNGQIDTSMTMKELKIDDIKPKLKGREKKARIVDLLKSRSGIYHNAAAVNNGMLKDRPKRGTHKPGEYDYYNNWDFNVLGAILEQETGKTIYDLFYDVIAKPIGMLDYHGEYTSIDGEAEDYKIPDTDGYYKFEKSQSKYPAYHFRMSTRDLALYGQLYLKYGVWNGKQILSQEWIDLITQPYSIYSPEYGSAYGMLWRVRVPNENTTRNSFYHTGLGIHMLGIYPDSKLVMVHRVNTESDFDYNEEDFYKMLNLLFNARENE